MMPHLEKCRWGKVWQVGRKATLNPAPPPPPSRREVGGGASGAGQETQVGQIMSGAEADTFTPFGRIAARVVARFGGLEA